MPNDLICRDESALAAKLAHFATAGANRLHLVFDFDRTLTVGRQGTDGDITIWHIMKEHLPPRGRDQYQALFNHYRALEVDGTMSQEHAVAWWSSTLDLFVKCKIDIGKVEGDLLSRATVRPQTKAIFDLCEQRQIPTIIMSAGIKDVINIWSRACHISPDVILSTSLILDENNIVRGWDKSTLVHALNKKELGHPELARIRTTRPLAIIVGDSLNDADMATGEANTLRIRIHDPRADELADIDAMRQKTFGQFDALIETGSLLPLRQLIEKIVRP